jgi:hypothetical protein
VRGERIAQRCEGHAEAPRRKRKKYEDVSRAEPRGRRGERRNKFAGTAAGGKLFGGGWGVSERVGLGLLRNILPSKQIGLKRIEGKLP